MVGDNVPPGLDGVIQEVDNMKDYDGYIIKPNGPDDVATIPYWVFELAQTRGRHLRRRLWLAVGVMTVALVAALVWR